jgi:hypothetical protein
MHERPGHSPAGSLPDGTFVHVPSVPTRLHAWQLLVHAEVQHTPSTQKSPAMQSWPRMHDPPGGRSGTQKPISQCATSMQSASPTHEVGHEGGG